MNHIPPSESPSVAIVHPARFTVGESIVWSAGHEALFFVDIIGRTINAFRPATGAIESWATPEFATCIGLRRDGGFIVGLNRRVALWEPGAAFETLAVPEPDLPDNRLNEGAVAPDGSFWVGTMQTNLEPDGLPRNQSAASGAYYRISPHGAVERLTPNAYGITNTMAWLDDGRFVTADTIANTFYAFDRDSRGGLSGRRIFHTGFPRGLPDGSCVDAAGHIWNCRVVDGACLVRFAPDGTVDRVVELPCAWPTSCAFGGPDLATLYITSARFTMSPERLAANFREGALMALSVGVCGREPNRFG